MSIYPVYLNDDPEDVPRLSSEHRVLVTTLLDRIETITGWLANPAHVLHQFLAARHEGPLTPEAIAQLAAMPDIVEALRRGPDGLADALNGRRSGG